MDVRRASNTIDARPPSKPHSHTYNAVNETPVDPFYEKKYVDYM